MDALTSVFGSSKKRCKETGKTMQKLEKMTLPELMDLRDRIEGKIQSLARRELSDLQKRMDSVRQLIEPDAPGKRRKANPKYKDPASGKTWSGRGITPIWLREYEENGRDRSDFLI